MRRYSSGLVAERAEWSGETLEREVILATSTQRGRDRLRKSRGEPNEIRRVSAQLNDMLVSGSKSPIPKRTEIVEEGLLARKLRRLKVE